MKQYQDLLRTILDKGERTPNRTGIDTIRIPSYQMEFDLQKGFPLVTTKQTPFKMPIIEMLWFLKGEMMLRDLLKQNVHIWTEWAFKRWVESDAKTSQFATDWKKCALYKYINNRELTGEERDYCNSIVRNFEDYVLYNEEFSKKYGDLKPCYGYQWRHFHTVDFKTGEIKEVDQIQKVLKEAKVNPNSRRLIVTAWNAGQLDDMALPPCHEQFQLLIINGKLNLHMYQRSCDSFLGVPFNISQYAALTHIFANILGLEVGTFTHTLGDAHIYVNHIEQCKEILRREPYELPKLEITRKFADIDDNIAIDDFKLIGYKHHDKLKGSVAI